MYLKKKKSALEHNVCIFGISTQGKVKTGVCPVSKIKPMLKLQTKWEEYIVTF